MRCPKATLTLTSLVLVAAWGGHAIGQEPPPPSPATEGMPGGEGAEEADAIREVMPAPGEYVYNPQGRRDPFMSLIKPVGPAGDRTRAGIEGFLIQELALKGIIKNNDGYIAFFTGPDNKSYWVRTGQRVFDGQLTTIDASTVTFRQDVTDPLAPVKVRTLKKSLYPSEEAMQ